MLVRWIERRFVGLVGSLPKQTVMLHPLTEKLVAMLVLLNPMLIDLLALSLEMHFGKLVDTDLAVVLPREDVTLAAVL